MSDTDACEILFITDVPMSERYPAGFSPRVLHFIRALEERFVVHTFQLVREAQSAVERDHSSPNAQSTSELTDIKPRTNLAKGRRELARLISPLPAFSRSRHLKLLSDVVERTRPRLVVIHLPYLAHLACGLADNLRVIFVLEESWEDVHDYGRIAGLSRLNHWRDRKRVRKLYEMVGRRSASVVAISDGEALRFRQHIPADKITVIPHGVDRSIFVRSPLSHEGKDIDVLIVGDMRQERNLKPVTALLQTATEHPAASQWRWFIVGPRPDDMVLCPLGTWTGYVDNLPAYYQRARSAVVPQNAGTGVKGTLLQAWVSGVPVITTTFCVASTKASPGQDVLVGDDAHSMLALTAEVLSDDHLADTLARKGLERAADVDLTVVSARFAALCGLVLRRTPA